ncbi:sulfur carrier protein ThiS [Acetoanaerobium sticklandii]|uniref:sulfur carrier protein ThiS n=1 Tax=Acetoanaerobium sticklandii TaxID=1511 RepID=UPI003A91963C
MPVINGEIYNNVANISLINFLNDNNYNVERIAVIINDLIISKEDYEKTFLQENDFVNIVNFVQGG